MPQLAVLLPVVTKTRPGDFKRQPLKIRLILTSNTRCCKSAGSFHSRITYPRKMESLFCKADSTVGTMHLHANKRAGKDKRRNKRNKPFILKEKGPTVKPTARRIMKCCYWDPPFVRVSQWWHNRPRSGSSGNHESRG